MQNIDDIKLKRHFVSMCIKKKKEETTSTGKLTSLEN